VQAEWCAKNNVEYLVHLNHEEHALRLDLPEDHIRNEGDFLRDMRYVEVPGIDNLSQLVPYAVHTPDGAWDVNNNFPKLASSAAHLFGKPKVWTESGGGSGIDGQVRVGLSTGEGHQTRCRSASRAGPARGRPAATGAHAGVVHRPGRLSDGHRTPGGPVGLYYPPAACGWATKRPTAA